MKPPVITAYRPLIVHVMGISNSGKSTLIRDLCNKSDKIGSVEVGSILRAKYPPEYFEGNAAPAKTEKEALEIYASEVGRNLWEKKSIILVDGQPRKASQVSPVFGVVSGFPHVCVLLYVSEEEAERRANVRDSGNVEAIKLSMKRIKGDKLQLFEVLVELGHERSPYIGDCEDIERQLLSIVDDKSTYLSSHIPLLDRTF